VNIGRRYVGAIERAHALRELRFHRCGEPGLQDDHEH